MPRQEAGQRGIRFRQGLARDHGSCHVRAERQFGGDRPALFPGQGAYARRFGGIEIGLVDDQGHRNAEMVAQCGHPLKVVDA